MCILILLANKSALCFLQRRHISRIGGKTLPEIIKNMMTEVMTYSMASQYSMYGMKSKKAFANLPICKTVIRKYGLIIDSLTYFTSYNKS